ncbi:hypothetical protein HA402_004022 [Bradysia odoriphaga]|nr:hypothetical protein HA402_004022 [Bradysia odoriphaga]
MSTIVCKIEFENSSTRVWYSGQLLKGQATIYFQADTHVKAIYVTFSGKGFCQWDDGVPSIGSIVYLDERLDFLPQRSDGDTIVRAGYSKYPFQIQLSRTLPTSYEGTYGYIRYVTSLHIECSRSAQTLHPLEELFTIIKPLNLNSTSSSYQTPMVVRKYVKFSQFWLVFCCKTDDIKMSGRLPVRGYCPGQVINLKLSVINRSFLSILHFQVLFIQEVTYTANNGHQNVERIVLSDRKTAGCRADHPGRQIINVSILVPSLPPTNFSANVCGSRYKIEVTAQTPMFHKNPTFEIPVVIGTYPISNELYSSSNAAENQASQNSTLSSAPPLDNLLSASSSSINESIVPPYPDEDPPTYEEASRNGLTGKNFVPKYPNYRRQTSYASEQET